MDKSLLVHQDHLVGELLWDVCSCVLIDSSSYTRPH